MAFLDETILHQLLQWHTFYWNTDQHGRILSDGLFHSFSTLLLLWGAFRLWRRQRSWAQPYRSAIVAAVEFRRFLFSNSPKSGESHMVRLIFSSRRFRKETRSVPDTHEARRQDLPGLHALTTPE